MDLDIEPDAVVVVAGVPGAGKTTLIDRAVDRTRAVVLDTDDRRREGRASRWKTVRVAGHYRRILTAVLLRRSIPVVVHSRGTTAFARRLVAALARLRNRPAHLVLLVAAADEAADGQLRRGRTIPPGEMDAHIERFAGLVAGHGAVARREGWASVTVLDREGAAEVRRIGPPAARRAVGAVPERRTVPPGPSLPSRRAVGPPETRKPPRERGFPQ
jgi:predicted kinase